MAGLVLTGADEQTLPAKLHTHQNPQLPPQQPVPPTQQPQTALTRPTAPRQQTALLGREKEATEHEG